MYILLYICVLLVNGLFMMLATLLPILIYNMTESSLYVGQVLTTFMVSLIIMRILCMKYKIKIKNLLLFGSLVFCLGFTLIYLFHSELWIYYLGAIFFGIAIAILAPSLLTILTNHAKHNNKNISVYNSLVAISSAFSPGIAEQLFNRSISVITLFWLVGAISLVFIVLYLSKMIKTNCDEVSDNRKEDIVLNCSGILVFKSKRQIQYIYSYLQ